jgi:hypothetical protein
MGRHAGLAILFTTLVVAAPVLAAANVPDPTWVGGFYDGADGDEVLVLVWDQSRPVVRTPTRFARRRSPCSDWGVRSSSLF